MFFINRFGRLYSFDRFILSISGEDKLLIIDMADKQLITKKYPNCSRLCFLSSEVPSNLESNSMNESHFYLQYAEGNNNFVFELCSIKNI